MSTLRPTSNDIAEARRLLGVRPGASKAAVVEAWRIAVRAHHPDAAPAAERSAAELACSRINAAKDLLLSGSNGAEAVASGPGPQWTTRGAPSSRAAGTPPRSMATTPPPRSTAQGTVWLLLLLVVLGVVGLGILAATTRPEGPGAPSGPEGDTTAGAGPDIVIRRLLVAAAARDEQTFGALLHPTARIADVEDLVTRLLAADASALAHADGAVECAPPQPGITDRQNCRVRVPVGLVPNALELRSTPAGWRLAGYAS